MTGFLIFSMIEIRPDVAFSIIVVINFTKNPSHTHIKSIKTIFQYIKGSMSYSITYGSKRKNLSIKNYSDSNWVGDKKSHKLTSSFIFILYGGPIS